MKNKKWIFIILAIIVLIGIGIYFFFSSSKPNIEPTPELGLVHQTPLTLVIVNKRITKQLKKKVLG